MLVPKLHNPEKCIRSFWLVRWWLGWLKIVINTSIKPGMFRSPVSQINVFGLLFIWIVYAPKFNKSALKGGLASIVEHFQNINRAPFWSLSRANVRMSFPSSQRLLIFQYGDLRKQKDPGNKPQQLIGWRWGVGCECEKTDMILCVYWGLRVHIISFT